MMKMLKRAALALALLVPYVSPVFAAGAYSSPIFTKVSINGCSGGYIKHGSTTCVTAIPATDLASGAAATNLGFTPLNPANNLSDLASSATARTNLGLGTLATWSPTGTASSSTYLRGDGSWVSPSGAGTVTSWTAGFGLTTSTSGGSGGSITSSGTAYYDPTQVGWAVRDKLINSGMLIDQRNAGAAYTLAPASGLTNYTLDRWYCYESASGTGLTAQQLSVRTGGVNYAQRIQRASASTNHNTTICLQVIESNNVVDLQGAAATLSARLRVGANWSGSAPTLSIITGTGVDQGAASLAAGSWTGQTTCGSASPTLSTSFTFKVVNCTFGSSITEAAVEISWTWSGTAGAADDLDFTDVELVLGTYTAAQIVPERHRIQYDLAECLRYFQYLPLWTGTVATATSVAISGGFLAPMRISPTATFVSGTSGLTLPGTGTYNVTAVSGASFNTLGGQITLTTSGLTSYIAYGTIGNTSLVVSLNAEL